MADARDTSAAVCARGSVFLHLALCSLSPTMRACMAWHAGSTSDSLLRCMHAWHGMPAARATHLPQKHPPQSEREQERRRGVAFPPPQQCSQTANGDARGARGGGGGGRGGQRPPTARSQELPSARRHGSRQRATALPTSSRPAQQERLCGAARPRRAERERVGGQGHVLKAAAAAHRADGAQGGRLGAGSSGVDARQRGPTGKARHLGGRRGKECGAESCRGGGRMQATNWALYVSRKRARAQRGDLVRDTHICVAGRCVACAAGCVTRVIHASRDA